MTKVLVLGDTHFGVSKSSEIYHSYFQKSLDQVFEYAKENSIETFIQTGDMFDYRREVHFTTIYRTHEYFFSRLTEAGITLYVISGNHDSTFKNTNRVNSVRSLVSHMSNVHVIDMEPKTVSIGSDTVDLYPWINTENISTSLEYAKHNRSKVAVGHFEFADFPLYPGNIADHGMDHKQFLNYDLVLSGHYHTRSAKDNVIYTGTPYELTWGDWNDPKGFWILDTSSLKVEFIRNPNTLHTKLEYSDGCDYDPSFVTEHYVKLVVQTKTNQKKFDAFVEKLSSLRPHELKIIEASITEDIAKAVGSDTVDSISTRSIVESVIENLETPLDRSILKQKIMTIFTEAEQLANS